MGLIRLLKRAPASVTQGTVGAGFGGLFIDPADGIAKYRDGDDGLLRTMQGIQGPPGTGTTLEEVQDFIGQMLVDSNNIDVTYDDAGNAETAVHRMKYMGAVTGASKTYVAGDIGGFYEHSNGGVGMAGVLPDPAVVGNGYYVEVHNTDTTAPMTFTAPLVGGGFAVIGTAATTYTLQPLCRQTFKSTGSKYLFGAGNANLTKAPTAGAVAAGDLVMVTDSTGRQLAKSVRAMLKLANTADILADHGAPDKIASGDATAAVAAAVANVAANGGLIYVPAGRFRLTQNQTITAPIEFNPGGRFVVSTGVTVTVNARVYAGIDQIFECEGTGKVVLSVAYNADRYAEWWGAVVGADCSPALTQCVVSGSRTWLQSRDYVTSATFQIPAYATVQGAGYNWEGTDTATRILCASASVSPIVQLGSTATPVDLNSAPASPALFDAYVTRNQAPNAGTVSVLVGWSRFARVERVRANTSITAFQVRNAISPFIDETFAKRDIAIAAGQGADRFVGYFIDGTGALPAAGGNASVWLTRPQTELNVAITDSTGYLVQGRFTDTFITQPETLGTNYGIDVLGDKGGGTSGVGTNANLVIVNPVVDQTKTLGIRIRDVNKWGTVHIIQPYCGPSTGDAVTASNCDGHIGISGGQMRMNVSTAGKGVTFDGCRSPFLKGTVIAECSTQALVLNNTQGGQFEPVIQNATATLAAAVQSVASVTKTLIRPSINGDPSKVSIGHQSLAASNAGNFVSLASVASGVVTTPMSYAAGAEVGTVNPDAAPTIARKTAAQALTATTATAITDLAVPLEANASYTLEIVVNIGAATGTTPTMAFSFTGPASPTIVSIRKDQMTTATAAAPAVVTAFAAYPALAVVANTVTTFKGTIVNGATAGTLQLLAAMAGTTPNVTVLQGSSIILTKTS